MHANPERLQDQERSSTSQLHAMPRSNTLRPLMLRFLRLLRLAFWRAFQHDAFATAKAAAYSSILTFFPTLLLIGSVLATSPAVRAASSSVRRGRWLTSSRRRRGPSRARPIAAPAPRAARGPRPSPDPRRSSARGHGSLSHLVHRCHARVTARGRASRKYPPLERARRNCAAHQPGTSAATPRAAETRPGEEYMNSVLKTVIGSALVATFAVAFLLQREVGIEL